MQCTVSVCFNKLCNNNLFVTLSRQLPTEAGAKQGLFAGNSIAAVDHCSIAKRLRFIYVCCATLPAHTALGHPEAK